MEDLPTVIRGVRQALGMRQADLAGALKVKRNTVSQYETKKATPSTMVLVRLHNVAPPGTLKDTLHARLLSDFEQGYPEHAEMAEGVIEELVTAGLVEARFPATKNKRRAEQLARFAGLVPRIAAKPILDESIIDILNQWWVSGDGATVKIFRDAAEYVRVRLDILAGLDLEEPGNAELMRQHAKSARRLAIELLRQADVAEEKSRLK
jgi:transcriptional regulator with XRE-family HTH domain